MEGVRDLQPICGNDVIPGCILILTKVLSGKSGIGAIVFQSFYLAVLFIKRSCELQVIPFLFVSVFTVLLFFFWAAKF
jgi:hypothetical protein